MVTTMNAMQIAAFRVLVKFGPLLLALCACAAAPSTFDPSAPVDVLNGSAYVTDDRIETVIDTVQSLAPSPVILDGWTITIDGDMSETIDYCGKPAGACSDTGTKQMHVAWTGASQYVTQTAANAAAASNLAHEMGHLYYLQTTGDPDADHTHAEWFSLSDPTSICSHVRDANKF
jgi:hypothetical protein